MNHTPLAPIFVRVNRASELFGFSRATAYRWAAMGHFRIYKRGNIAFLNVKEETAYLDGGAAGREHGLPGELA